MVKVGPHIGSERLGVLESEVPPGGGFPPHVHDQHEEAFYVLSGAIDYLVGDAWTAAVAGTVVFVPAGEPHGFRNSSEQPARHLAIASPASAMTMIEQLMTSPQAEHAQVLERFRSHFA